MNPDIYNDLYLKDAQNLQNYSFFGESAVEWQSPSNIALIKYWGKHGNQLPNNASLSATLKNSVSRTEIVFQTSSNDKNDLEFYYNDTRNSSFEKKISVYIKALDQYLPFIKELKLVIRSVNTFPHSAGIASSASSISSLALCLVSIENKLFGTLTRDDDLLKKASFLARIGSGSACRSVFGKYSVWGETQLFRNSSDELAVSIDNVVHSDFFSLNNAILVVDSSPKEVSSSQGHLLMKEHYYKEGRKFQASQNLPLLSEAMKKGDWEEFSDIVENEALSLHALLMSSYPGSILLKPNTLEIIRLIKNFRKLHKLPLTFTLDAGPNIHLLYPQNVKDTVKTFIQDELVQFCENGFWIDDTLSEGAICLKK